MNAEIKPFKRSIDIADRRTNRLLQANVDSAEIMYNALKDIAQCELYEDGGLAAQAIAIHGLMKVHAIMRDLPRPEPASSPAFEPDPIFLNM